MFRLCRCEWRDSAEDVAQIDLSQRIRSEICIVFKRVELVPDIAQCLQYTGVPFENIVSSSSASLCEGFRYIVASV